MQMTCRNIEIKLLMRFKMVLICPDNKNLPKFVTEK